jgi:hypothetical protein
MRVGEAAGGSEAPAAGGLAHSYTSRKRRSTMMLTMFISSVMAKSVSPTAKMVWYSTCRAAPRPC